MIHGSPKYLAYSLFFKIWDIMSVTLDYVPQLLVLFFLNCFEIGFFSTFVWFSSFKGFRDRNCVTIGPVGPLGTGSNIRNNLFLLSKQSIEAKVNDWRKHRWSRGPTKFLLLMDRLIIQRFKRIIWFRWHWILGPPAQFWSICRNREPLARPACMQPITICCWTPPAQLSSDNKIQ